MRTVTFSDPSIAPLVNRHFVSAWKNKSPNREFADGLYDRTTIARLQECVRPGAGADNVVAVFATPDGRVLNAVPGFLNVKGFQSELVLARELHGGMFDGEGKLREGAEELYRKLHALRAKDGTTNTIASKAHERLAQKGPLTVDDLGLKYFDDLAPRG